LGPARDTGRDALIRAAWDRRLGEPGGSWGATGAAQPVLSPWTVAVPRHDDAPSQTAVVTLRPLPHRRAEPRAVPPVTAVGVREDTPPEGTAPLAWLRLTPWPVEDRTAADTVGRSETSRGRLARSQDVLTRGCPRDDLPRDTCDRSDRALAVSRMVAGRLLGLTDLARAPPEAPWSHRLASR
jgi:hypothetical protein